ncbi:MAG: hypothetical protein LBR83_06785 [Clostridiales bacterium]|jgi:hypothetical protein|nr:hypothetical protein [Clostridiales bacterium]
MIDFKEEIKKYKPALGMENVEDAVKDAPFDEMKDVMDLLQYISNKIPTEPSVKM